MIGYVLMALMSMAVVTILAGVFLVSIIVAPIAGALVGALSETGTARIGAGKYTSATLDWYGKQWTSAKRNRK
jgi:hypothetical protein